MKKLLFIFIFIFINTVINVSASNFSAGMAIGSPTGLNYSYRLNNEYTLEGVIGWSLSNNKDNIDIYYLKNEKDKFMLQAYNLDFKLGYGIKLLGGNAGPSVLAGVEHKIDKTSFKLLANANVVVLYQEESLSSDLGAYLGARYNF
jgi:hypothetical protein